MVNYHNYNNVKFVINNQVILVDSASFSANPALSPQEKMGQKGGFEYVADGGIKGSLSLGYYLVGSDPLKPFLNSEDPITIEAGGLTIQKAYLNSYSLAGATHGPVKVEASLVLYEDFGGAFSPTTLPDKDYDYLRLADMELVFQGMDASSKIKGLSYEMSCEPEPMYRIGDLTPGEIRFNKRTQSLRISTYNFEEALPYTGKDVNFTFSLGPETYIINGKLQSKNVNFTFGEKLSAEFSLNTTSYEGAPTLVESNTGATKNIGEYWNIYGYNLTSATAIYFNNNVIANEFTTFAHTTEQNYNSEIKVKIPRFARSGPIRVFTPYGEAAHQQRSGGASIIANINSVYVP